MKTSFDISEPVLRDIKALAKRRGTTTRSVVEQALLRLLEAEADRPAFRLKDASVAGRMTPEFESASWEEVRDVVYGMPRS